MTLKNKKNGKNNSVLIQSCNSEKKLAVQHVFIIGSKGIPGAYGGYETFVDKLTEYHQNTPGIKYHVACKANGRGVSVEMAKREARYEYHNADCFKVDVPEIGAAEAVVYDCRAFRSCLSYIKQNELEKPIVYVLTCRIGPFISKYKRELEELGGMMYLNPDGHEWKRAKWSKPVRWYWKKSEELMVKYADLIVCDSKNIEKYIQKTYKNYNPRTTYIAYGAETKPSMLADNDKMLLSWYDKWQLSKGNYYLIVGRFVPENNFETMIREFMSSSSKRNLAIITTKDDKFLRKLDVRLNFSKDARIKFVGTVYDKELLKKIRENAYGYIHGHEVGGTNPSLLEALGSTPLNLLLDVGFNKECGEDGALYWNKESGDLSRLINRSDAMTKLDIENISCKAKNRIETAYSWGFIGNKYATLWKKHKRDFI